MDAKLYEDAAKNIFNQVRLRLGDAWDDFAEKDKQLVYDCSADAAKLQINALALSPSDAAGQRKLVEDKADIHAQLLNLTAGESSRVAAIFWDVVRAIVNGLVAVAFAAL